MKEPIAITIGRQYGSGGREIGQRVGEQLGFRVYDRDLITLAAEKSGVSPDYLRRVDEKATNSLLYTLAMGSSLYGARHLGVDVPINDRLFITQTDIIKQAAEEESCVFIGRCADYVLRNHPGRLSFFIHADIKVRAKRIAERHQISYDEAVARINKTDKQRVNYYNFYTGRKWGRFDNYHLSIDSSVLGIEGTARAIADVVRVFMTESEEDRKM